MSVSRDYIELREAMDYSNAVRAQETKNLVERIKVSRRPFEPVWLVRDPNGCLWEYYGFKPKKLYKTTRSHPWTPVVSFQLKDCHLLKNGLDICPFVKAEDSEPTRVVINKNGEFVNDVNSKLEYLKEKIKNELSTLDLCLPKQVDLDKLSNAAITAILDEAETYSTAKELTKK